MYKATRIHNKNKMGTKYCGTILSFQSNPGPFFFLKQILIKNGKINR